MKTCKTCHQILPQFSPKKDTKKIDLEGLTSVYYIAKDGKIVSKKNGKVLKINNRRVMLPINRMQKSFKVAYLVALHFYPNFKDIENPVILFKDSDRNNFHIDNLDVV